MSDSTPEPHRIYQGVWRIERERTDGYPSLSVDENMVTGSIVIGHKRLALWYAPVRFDFDDYRYDDGTPTEEQERDATQFVHDLLEQRGEFGRLLMALAEAERCERKDRKYRAWWEMKKHRRRVLVQLRRCVTCLEEMES